MVRMLLTAFFWVVVVPSSTCCFASFAVPLDLTSEMLLIVRFLTFFLKAYTAGHLEENWSNILAASPRSQFLSYLNFCQKGHHNIVRSINQLCSCVCK
jgi:hypothetical protein